MKQTKDDKIRLNKFIANAGVCSRREADKLIEAGLVKINGKVVKELGTKVSPRDKIKYKNQPLSRERKVYVLLNKPKDFLCTVSDDRNRKTVMDLIRKAARERLYPVGRLDRNTTGLLLLTNDGQLAQSLSHPSKEIEKIYHVELNKPLKEDHLEKIKQGIHLEDGNIKPDNLEYVEGASENNIGIELHSGRNRIVRRIFEHFGYNILKLDRVIYAGLTKKDLPRKKWRYLSQREIATLKGISKKSKHEKA